MAASKNKIAEAYVELSAKVDRLEQEMQDAKVTVDRETKEIGDTAEKNIGGGFERAGQKIDGATAPLRKFSGALSATVGIATALIGAFTAIVGILGSLVTLAKSFERKQAEAAAHAREQERLYSRISDEFARQLALLSGAAASQVDYESKWKEINSLYAEGNLQLIHTNELLLRLNEVRKREITDEKQRIAETERLEAQAAERRRQQIQRENELIEISRLDGADRINAEEEMARREMLQRIANEEDQLVKNALERRLTLIREEFAARRDALVEQERLERRASEERERRDRESAERIAKATERSITSALERISASQVLDNSALQGSLDRMARTLDAIHGSQGWGG